MLVVLQISKLRSWNHHNCKAPHLARARTPRFFASCQYHSYVSLLRLPDNQQAACCLQTPTNYQIRAQRTPTRAPCVASPAAAAHPSSCDPACWHDSAAPPQVLAVRSARLPVQGEQQVGKGATGVGSCKTSNGCCQAHWQEQGLGGQLIGTALTLRLNTCRAFSLST